MATQVDIEGTNITASQMSEFFRLAAICGSHVNRRTLQSYLERSNPFGKMVSKPILRDITGDNVLTLPPSDGSRIIATANETFPGWIDPDFRNYGADEPGRITKEMRVRVYEMVKNAAFIPMFGSMLPFLGEADVLQREPRFLLPLTLTQHQIIDFAELYPDWLRGDGFATFIPFWSYDAAFVACVDVHPDGLDASADRLEFRYEWHTECRRRVVLPELG